MKALTLKNPWATLLFTPIRDDMGVVTANGIKTIETRKWKTNYRGPVLITVSQNPDRNYQPIPEHHGICRYCGCSHYDPCVHPQSGSTCSWGDASEAICDPCLEAEKELAGMAIGVVHLVDCHPMHVDDRVQAGIDLYPGAWSFVMTRARPIVPFEITGRLGLWEARLDPDKFIYKDALPHPWGEQGFVRESVDDRGVWEIPGG